MLIRKRDLFIFGIIIILIGTIIGGCFAVSALNDISRGVIVIDAGHGGIDGGVSIGNLKEADINLEYSRILERKLAKKGYKVVQTRESINSLSDKKKEDMEKRAEIINKTKPDMVISLHVNKYSDSSRRGVQVFYDDTDHFKEVGERMQSILNTYVNSKFCGRNDLQSLGGDYYITKCSPHPSIIIECGFISNHDDRALLTNDKYKNSLLDAIVEGIISMTSDIV